MLNEEKIVEKEESGNKASPDSTKLEKSKSHIIVEIIEYVPNSVVIKTIIKKSTGSISIMSFDSGEGLTEKTSPFDTFAQIIEGKAEIVIDKVSNLLQSGQGIIIPAHSPNFIKPNGRFKMILTIIKCGYE
ncbi:MAG TPA: cupin domain-containing protein [Puia sp.]|nr:cupin domain-containing protein [Puia sp.]